MDDIDRFKTLQASIGAGYAYNYVPAEGWLIGGLLMPMATFLNQSKTYRYDTSNGGFVKGDVETQNHPIDYNIDGRMAVTRCWEDWFVSVAGQLNHFYYRQKHTRGQTTDWFVTLSVGTRFDTIIQRADRRYSFSRQTIALMSGESRHKSPNIAAP